MFMGAQHPSPEKWELGSLASGEQRRGVESVVCSMSLHLKSSKQVGLHEACPGHVQGSLLTYPMELKTVNHFLKLPDR